MRNWPFLIALVLAAAPSAADDSTGVGVTATVAATCTVSFDEAHVVNNNPLHLRIDVTRDCNATHQMVVTYLPAALTGQLSMKFNGIDPDQLGSGSATFSNLPATQTTRQLHIFLDGPQSERAAFHVTSIIIQP